MSEKKIYQETWKSLEKKYKTKGETESFSENVENLYELAEEFVEEYFPGKNPDRVQKIIISEKLPAVIFYLRKPIEERTDISKRWKEFYRDLYKVWSFKVEGILKDDYLIEYLGLDKNLLIKKKEDLKSFKETNKGLRAGYNKDLEYALIPIFSQLTGFKIKQKNQIEFIYNLFKKFAPEGYGGILQSGNRERIRKMQENAIRVVKDNLSHLNTPK